MCEYIRIHTMSVFIYLGIEPVFVRAQKYLFMREFSWRVKMYSKICTSIQEKYSFSFFLRLHSHRLDANAAEISQGYLYHNNFYKYVRQVINSADFSGKASKSSDTLASDFQI